MANGTNLTLFINFKKNLMEINANINALIKPAMKNGRTSPVMYSQFFNSDKKLAPAMIGTAMMKVKSAAARWLKPISTPPDIVDPEREKPGHKAIHWNKPMKNACLLVI